MCLRARLFNAIRRGDGDSDYAFNATTTTTTIIAHTSDIPRWKCCDVRRIAHTHTYTRCSRTVSCGKQITWQRPLTLERPPLFDHQSGRGGEVVYLAPIYQCVVWCVCTSWRYQLSWSLTTNIMPYDSEKWMAVHRTWLEADVGLNCVSKYFNRLRLKEPRIRSSTMSLFLTRGEWPRRYPERKGREREYQPHTKLKGNVRKVRATNRLVILGFFFW